MLSEDQLDIFGDELTEIYQRLEEEVINDIARRVRKSERWTETAELQARFLRDLGYSPARIRTEVLRKLRADPAYIDWVDQNTLEAKAVQQDAINTAKAELRRAAPELYETVGNMSWNNDLSMWQEAGMQLRRGGAVDRIIREMKQRGLGELMNLTKTTGFAYPTGLVSSRQAFTSALNDALTKTVSGTFSYQSALDAAVKQLTQSGLRTVDFKDGVSRQIDTAARNALLTSMGQLSGEIMQENIEASGVDMVQVSSHWGARESHAAWQGGVYTLEQFRTVCGYGEPSNPDHIYSYNCRHTHYPYWPGISEPIEYQPEPEPVTVNGRTYTYYQATQKQRGMEREIRALKREVNAGGDKAVLGSRIRQKTQEYDAFSKATNIRPKLERLTVFGYDRSTATGVRAAMQASGAAKSEKIEAVRKLIRSDVTPKTLNVGSQNKHILGSKGYIAGRSYIFGDLDAAQELVNRYHGTGDIKLTRAGNWSGRESITVDYDIGTCINPNNGEQVTTNRFTIHYGKKGTHIVPAERRGGQ